MPGWTSHATKLAVALLLVHLALVLPDRLQDLQWAAFFAIPIELPIVLGLLFLPLGKATPVVRWIIAAALTLLVVLKLAAIASYIALSRPFDLLLDLYLLDAGWRLLSGSIGTAAAMVAVTAALLGTALVAFLLAWAAKALTSAATRRRPAFLAGAGVAAGIAFIGLASGVPPVAIISSEVAAGQVVRTIESAADLAAFREEAADDPITAIPGDTVLNRLRGRDFIIVFVESYGATALTDPQYGHFVLPVLQQFDRVLATKGYAARSAFLMSTTMGGESWRAHSSLQAGVRVDNERRYQALVFGNRGNIIRDAKRAGWDTAVVMPAITMAWPEGRFYGYDRIHAAADLGYRGKPFDWITMPDQYTLSAFERLERSRPGRAPLMAVIALISSHTPWTPLPHLVGWDEVGDGTIFNAAAEGGDSEAVVWRDPDRIRLQYRLSIEYTLSVLSSYVERFGDRNLVMMIVGDHPPLPLVAGENASRAVPVHLIAGDPEVLSGIAEWGWTPGMQPDATAPTWPMESMRSRLVAAFSAGPVPH